MNFRNRIVTAITVIAAATILLNVMARTQNTRRPVNIVAIGDSITHGGYIKNVGEWTYRLPLQRLLLENDIPFNFVGTRSEGFSKDVVWSNPVPGIPFAPDHEAEYGAKTAAVRDLLATNLLEF